MAVVSVVTMAVGMSGLAQTCYGVNQLDLSPAHAGTLMGLTNMLATIPGFVGPQVVGALTYFHSGRVEWQRVFYIAGSINVASTLTYLIFGSGELQSWAVEPYRMSVNDVIVENDEDEE